MRTSASWNRGPAHLERAVLSTVRTGPRNQPADGREVLDRAGTVRLLGRARGAGGTRPPPFDTAKAYTVGPYAATPIETGPGAEQSPAPEYTSRSPDRLLHGRPAKSQRPWENARPMFDGERGPPSKNQERP